MNKKLKKLILTSIVMTLFFSIGITVYAIDKPNSTWVPTEGYAFAIDGSAYENSVYMYSDFSWSSESRMTGLKDDNNETLEMDIIYYNYDGNGYSYKWYNKYENAYRGTYWETNQPRPYVDTQGSDGSDERSFSIGSSDANQFVANTLYYWWAYGDKNSDGSMTKLNVQRGYRYPSWAYEDPWSVFAEETVNLVPFSNWTTPGSIDWTY